MYEHETLTQRIEAGTDWSHGQKAGIWGYIVITPNGAAVDTTIKFYESDKTGDPVWEDVLDTSAAGERIVVTFSRPLRVKDAVVEVAGTGGVAYVSYQ